MMTRPPITNRTMIAGLVLAIGSWLAPPLAHAQTAGESSADDATALQQGLALYEKGDDRGAIEHWEALRQKLGDQKSWKLLYNLGLAYERIKDATHAVERFDAFVRYLSEQPSTLTPELDDRRQDALERLQKIKATHGAIELRAPARGPPPMVRVGSEPARPAGFTAYVVPGNVDVEIDSGTKRVRSLNVRAGSKLEIDTTELETKPVAIPAPSTKAGRPAHPARKRFPTMWVLVGSGATALSFALPLALGLRASSKKQDAEDLGTGNTQYGTLVDDYERARTLYYASYALPAAIFAVTIAVTVVKLEGPAKEAVTAGVQSQRGGAEFCVSGRF